MRGEHLLGLACAKRASGVRSTTWILRRLAPWRRYEHNVLVPVPGANTDGRPDLSDRLWQAFASRNEIALIGCHFTDKPHEESFIENYANAGQGSGQALLDVLIAFSKRSNHPELANAPLLLWGFSAGGEFNYEFTAWKPERVVAFVVNKGGIYFSALLPAAARRVPGLLFAGEQDLESRKRIISGLFALNRRAGALWAFAEEPNAGHVVGRSREMAAIFFRRGAGITCRLGQERCILCATDAT